MSTASDMLAQLEALASGLEVARRAPSIVEQVDLDEWARTARELAGTLQRLKVAAEKAGAGELCWVTPEGYTQLSEVTRHALKLSDAGGFVWFLPNASGRQEAWHEAELNGMYGSPEGPEKG